MTHIVPQSVKLIGSSWDTRFHLWVLRVPGYEELWYEGVHVCPDATSVLPWDDKCIYLTRQQRAGVMSTLVGDVPREGLVAPFQFRPNQAMVLAAPGGVIDGDESDGFEAPSLAALRELEEEMGLLADPPVPVGPRVWSNPGRSTERVNHFLARVRERGKQREKDQHIKFRAFPLAELDDLIKRAEDRATLLLLYALDRHLAPALGSPGTAPAGQTPERVAARRV